MKSSLDKIAGKSAYAHVPTLLGYTTGENIPIMPTPDDFRTVMEKDLGDWAEEFFQLCPLEDKTEWEKFKFYSCSELLRSSCEAWAKLVEQQNNPPAYVYTLSRHLPGDDAGAFHGSCLTAVHGSSILKRRYSFPALPLPSAAFPTSIWSISIP